MKKISLAIIGFFILFLPLIAQADSQLCWEKKKCIQTRHDFYPEGTTDKELEAGFVQNQETAKTCGTTEKKAGDKVLDQVGWCLPAGQSVTKISFGGKKNFSNFGDFIQYAYRYGMWLAGIVAVAFIVISGAQWAASGGNSDMIGSAKKRIAGAVSGLILLALSYTILNTINPYLVSLRLPATWMINELGIVPPFCNEVEDKKLKFIITPNEKTTSAEIQKKIQELAKNDFTTQPSEATCGSQYQVEGGGSQMCLGKGCKENQVCARNNTGTVDKPGVMNNTKQCYIGELAVYFSLDLFGDIKSQIPFIGLGTSQLEDDEWLTYKKAYAIGVCRDNNPMNFQFCFNGNTDTEKTLSYTQNLIKGTIMHNYRRIYSGFDGIKCPTGQTLRGIMIEIELSLNWEWDKNVYLGIPASGNEAIFGDFGSVYEQIKKDSNSDGVKRLYQSGGLELDARLSSETVSLISGKKNQLSKFTNELCSYK